MSETGIRLYDLGPECCAECGRPVVSRLWDVLGECGTCNDEITRHRCTGRPALDSLGTGESWTCPDCGSIWTVTEQEESCGQCGGTITAKTWAIRPGDRIDTAVRHEPSGFTPLRNALPRRDGV